MAQIIGKTDEGKDIYGLDFDLFVKRVKETNDGRRIFSMIGSTPNIDRDGDTINQKGWVTKHYKKNSVVQWAHDHKIPAIAKVNKFSINGALRFNEIEFPKEGVHPLADMIASLMEDGFIKSGSVGFMPIKSEKREMSDKEKEAEPDYFCQPVNFEKQELLEFSICNVGSNRDALVDHLGQKGFQTSGKVRIDDHEFEMKQLIDALFVEDDPTEEKDKEVIKEEKRVIPFKHYTLDPEDAAWSGPTERAAADIPILLRISTWFDAENPDVKSSYKLPHHRASNHNTVWNGVRAAMAALLGARGGVDIPESDRAAVHSHLAKHHVEFGKDVPELKEYSEVELKEIFPGFYDEKEYYDPEQFEDAVKEQLDMPTDKDGSLNAANKYCTIVRNAETNELSLKLTEAFKELHGQDVRLAWKSEATERCFEANLQAYDTDKDKWFNVEAITIQDIEEKAGAVLSKTNKSKLKQAQSLIGEVLTASEPVETVTEDGTDNNPQLPENDLKEILDHIGNMEKAIDALAIAKKEEDVVEGDNTEDENEIEIDIEETPPKEKEIEIEDVEEEIDLKDVASVIGEAIKPMAQKIIKSELRKVTGKID